MRKQKRGEDEIKRMKDVYDEGKSLAEVGSEFGISPSRVEQIFRRNNIETRPVTVSRKFLKAIEKRRVIFDKATLVKLYTEEKLSIQKIADRLVSTYDIVRRNLLNYKIPIRPRTAFTQSRLTRELLRRLYIEDNLTAPMIAERLGYSARTIGKKLSLMGINKRDAVRCRPDEDYLSGTDDAPLSSATFLTVKEMSVKYDLHEITVRKMLSQNHFPHAFWEGKGQCARWLVPVADLKNFSARRED